MRSQPGRLPSLPCLLKDLSCAHVNPEAVGGGHLILYLAGSGRRTPQDASLPFLPFPALLRGVRLPALVALESSSPTLSSCGPFLKGGVNSLPGGQFSQTLEQGFALSPIPVVSCGARKKKKKTEKNIEIEIPSDSSTDIQTAAPDATNLLPRVTKILSGAGQLLKVRLAVPVGRFGPRGLGIQILQP